MFWGAQTTTPRSLLDAKQSVVNKSRRLMEAVDTNVRDKTPASTRQSLQAFEELREALRHHDEVAVAATFSE